jgi:hypothetical protein
LNRKPIMILVFVAIAVVAFIGGAASGLWDKPAPVSAIQAPTIDLAPNPGDPGPGSVSVPLSTAEVELTKLGFVLDYVDARPDRDGMSGLPGTTVNWVGTDKADDEAPTDLELTTVNGALNALSGTYGSERCIFEHGGTFVTVSNMLTAGQDALDRSAKEWKSWTEKAQDGEPMENYVYFFNGTPDDDSDDGPVTLNCYHPIVKGG